MNKRLKIAAMHLLFISLILSGCFDNDSTPSDASTASGLTLNCSSLSLLTGNSYQLIPSKPDVSWSSDDSTIADVDSDGNVTGIKEGNAIITATSIDSEHTAICAVSVTNQVISVTGVTVDMSSVEIQVNGTVDLNETIIPPNATNHAVNWTSSSTYVATVDSNGVVKGMHTGSAEITVKTVDGGKTAKCNIAVKAVPVSVTGISLDRSNINILPNLNVQLVHTVEPSNATNKDVKWFSSNTDIAEVTSTGLITGKNPGTAEIKVITVDGNIEDFCGITVDQHPVVTTGYYTKSITDYPCYWINTTKYELTAPSGYQAYAINAGIDDGNLFISGNYQNILWGVIAYCYWKNNELFILPKPAGSSFEGSVKYIKLNGGDIYHGGIIIDSTESYGVYWINNVRHELPMPAGYNISNLIKFDMLENGKVLSVSEIFNSTTSDAKLCYWIDEEYHELTIPDNAVNASFPTFSISQNNIYFTVKYQVFEGPNTVNYISYWINDVKYDLTTADITNMGKSEMQIIDGKVFITGQYSVGGDIKYCVWSDKNRIDLPVPPFSSNIKTDVVAVSGNSVYVLGSYVLSSQKIPCYWLGSDRHDPYMPA
ncbi:MAG: Ig domain-containing protein [Spirochaetes bacterium]|nr:Ig domain-containing protein [Spirochaetota bacterium]